MGHISACKMTHRNKESVNFRPLRLILWGSGLPFELPDYLIYSNLRTVTHRKLTPKRERA